MGGYRLYTEFNDEVERDIKKFAPAIVYKYRNWKDKFHKRVLTHREAWFAHPFTLNDSHDIRRPLSINPQGYNSPSMLAKLWQQGKLLHPLMDDVSLAKEVNLRWRQIQMNPIGYFERHMHQMYNDYSFYAKMGIFSTSRNGLSRKLWTSEEYSDDEKGYCIGFNTLELAREFQYYMGKVVYTNQMLEVFVTQGFTDEHSRNEVMMKYPKWSHEEEYRFITFDIQNENRIRCFPKSAVSEILIGRKADFKSEREIIGNTRRIYGSNVPIYKMMDIGGILNRELLSV